MEKKKAVKRVVKMKKVKKSLHETHRHDRLNGALLHKHSKPWAVEMLKGFDFKDTINRLKTDRFRVIEEVEKQALTDARDWVRNEARYNEVIKAAQLRDYEDYRNPPIYTREEYYVLDDLPESVKIFFNFDSCSQKYGKTKALYFNHLFHTELWRFYVSEFLRTVEYIWDILEDKVPVIGGRIE